MKIDLTEIAKIIGTLSAIIGGLLGLSQWLKKCIERTISGQLELLENRIKKQESWNRKQQVDIDNGHEYNIVITRGVRACLQGLHEQGCNGRVTSAMNEMDDFLLSQANQGQSHRSNDEN